MARQRESDLESARAAAAAAAEREIQAQADASAAQARLQEARTALAATGAERDRATEGRAAALQAREDAERRCAVMEEALRQMESRLAEFGKLKAEFLETTRATTFTTAQQISSKLLEDHKRESEAAKQDNEARVKQATGTLLEQLEKLAGTVAALQSKVDEDAKSVGTILRALSTPGGAGQHAEVGLANTLKAFGLEQGRDFALQFSAGDADTGQRLRPDAVIFLPGDDVLVVDCKASKFLLEIAAAEGTPDEGAAYDSLARTMQQHLKALAQKEYRAAVAEDCRRSGRTFSAQVTSLMYLPNDAALEKLRRADPLLGQVAAKHSILLVGPSGLSCAIAFASRQITTARQVENQQRIAEGARALLEAIVIVLGHAANVGKGIKSAAESYERLTSSINRTLLGRARRLESYGLRPTKPLPGALPAYHVNIAETLIEGEAEQVAEEAPRPRLIAEVR
jgi:DNA recombination protein RmuC